jgi:hypothetical protein
MRKDGQAEQHADRGGDEARQDDHHGHVEPGHGRHQLVGGVGADRHEAPRAERHLPAIARQDVQPDGGEAVDQEGQKDRLLPVVVDQERHDEEGDGHQRPEGDAVELHREDLQILGVGGLEVAGLAVDHVAGLPAIGGVGEAVVAGGT